MDGSSRGTTPERVRPALHFRVELDRLGAGGTTLRIAPSEKSSHGERVLRIIVGSGRGCALHGAAMPTTVLVLLRGTVRAVDGEHLRILGKGQVLICEDGQPLQVFGSASALWIALVGPARLWGSLMSATVETHVLEPVLFPATHRADRIVSRAALRLARDAARGANGKADAMAGALRFATLLAELQSGFDSMIRRCPGRTLAQRRGVFLRLQRVLHCMESAANLSVGIGEFARIANYSTCHFIRTFSAVYGQTPHGVLMEQRLKRALHLVHDTELSITEVARASGFEDRCAFARSFKRRFGQSATSIRTCGGSPALAA
jgi:AraC family transcriptional regulator